MLLGVDHLGLIRRAGKLRQRRRASATMPTLSCAG
jgi:hypothetical protein